jgi:hypothetical protein
MCKPFRHPADPTIVPEILSNLRKEFTRRKLEWLHEVMPYVYIIAVFLVIYLIHHATTIK